MERYKPGTGAGVLYSMDANTTLLPQRGTTFFLIAVFVVLFSAGRAQAYLPTGFFSESETRMGLDYLSFSGPKDAGFSSASNGYGLEVGRVLSTTLFSFFGKIRGLYASGSEYFLDGSTEKQLTYNMLGSEAYLGLLIHLIPLKDTGFRPYVGAAGGAGIVQIRLPASSVSTLRPSETEMELGYELIAGLELNMKHANGTGYWSIYGEFILRNMRANMLNQNPFYLDGITLAGGVGW